MKKIYLSTLFCFVFYFLMGQSTTFSIQSASNKANHPDSFNLPFTEDWSSGSLETNNWTTGCENWAINYQQGNENPSVEFTWDPWFQSEYSCSLVSDVFNGDLLEVGQIMLDFDIRLDSRQATGNEKLLVEVFDGTDWNTVAEFANEGNIDWQENSIDITDYALAHTFQIRFNATGLNSLHILSWFVDNISVYRVCEAPSNLDGQIIFPNPYGEFYVELEWKAPESTIVDEFNWLHWDDGENDDGIGLTNGGDLSVAAKWIGSQLVEYDGDTLQAVKFFLNDDGFTEIIVKIWTGENAESLIYQDTLDNPEIGEWIEHELDTLLIINSDTTIFVGYEIINQLAGYFPAGIDGGPALPGYGDLIYTESGGWENISDFGIDNNFNIQMKLLNNDAFDSTNCIGFNIYRQNIYDDPDYIWIAFSPFIDYQTWYLFLEDYTLNEYICYKVAAVWSNEGDSCISDFAIAKYNPDDYVCVYGTMGIHSNRDKDMLNIYPNPTSSKLNITTKDGTAIEKFSIYNLTGQMVLQGKPENNSINISQLQAGMYVVEVDLGQRKIREKIVVK